MLLYSVGIVLCIPSEKGVYGGMHKLGGGQCVGTDECVYTTDFQSYNNIIHLSPYAPTSFFLESENQLYWLNQLTKLDFISLRNPHMP